MGRRYVYKNKQITFTSLPVPPNNKRKPQINSSTSINTHNNDTIKNDSAIEQFMSVKQLSDRKIQYYLKTGLMKSNNIKSISEVIRASSYNGKVESNKSQGHKYVHTPHKKRVIVLNSDMHLDLALKINKNHDSKIACVPSKIESKKNEIPVGGIRKKIVIELNDYLKLAKSSIGKVHFKPTRTIVKKSIDDQFSKINLKRSITDIDQLQKLPSQKVQGESLLEMHNKDDNKTYLLVSNQNINTTEVNLDLTTQSILQQSNGAKKRDIEQTKQSQKSLSVSINSKKYESRKSMESVMTHYQLIKSKPKKQIVQANQVTINSGPIKQNQLLNLEPHALPQNNTIKIKKTKPINNTQAIIMKVRPLKSIAMNGSSVLNQEHLIFNLGSAINSNVVKTKAKIGKKNQTNTHPPSVPKSSLLSNLTNEINSFNVNTVTSEQSNFTIQGIHDVFPVGALQTVESECIRLFTKQPEEEESEILGF